MAHSSDFVIQDGVLKKYLGVGGDVVIPEGVKRIAARAFEECEELRSVEIPESVKSVGKEAFASCDQLRWVIFRGEAERIGKDFLRFSYRARVEAPPETFKKAWGSLGELRMNYTVIGILIGGALSSQETKYIRSHIRDIFNVSVLKKKAVIFMKALQYTEVLPLEELDLYLERSKELPELSAALLEYKKEHYSPELVEKMEEIRQGKELGLIPRTVAEWKRIFSFQKNGDEITICKYLGMDSNVIVPERIGRSRVTRIAASAFYNCMRISSVAISEGVREIGMFSFFRCRNLETVVLPQSLESIEKSVFEGCVKLCGVTLPEGLEHVGERAFAGCDALADENGFIVVDDVLYDYNGSDTEICIPEHTKIIGDGAFFKQEKLRSVVFPPSVRRIEKNAFMYCASLERVSFSKELREICDEAFCGCKALTEIFLPDGAQRLGNAAFWGCEALRCIRAPESLTEIGTGAFGRCEGLAYEDGFLIVNGILCAYIGHGGTIAIPEGVKRIQRSVFANYWLLSLHLPESLEELGDAFKKSKVISSVVLPKGLKTVESKAFMQCPNLQDVTIPDPNTVIEEDAFLYTRATLHGVKGSPTEGYANKHHLPFEPIE